MGGVCLDSGREFHRRQGGKEPRSSCPTLSRFFALVRFLRACCRSPGARPRCLLGGQQACGGPPGSLSRTAPCCGHGQVLHRELFNLLSQGPLLRFGRGRSRSDRLGRGVPGHSPRGSARLYLGDPCSVWDAAGLVLTGWAPARPWALRGSPEGVPRGVPRGVPGRPECPKPADLQAARHSPGPAWAPGLLLILKK